MYYLYEIIGKKVGVTQNITRRQREQKYKGELIILGEYTDIYLVSKIERETQANKGYHVDKDPYWYTVTVQSAKSCTKEAIKKQIANNDFRKASIGSTRKFTAEEVIAIRKEYENNPDISAVDLSKKYKVAVWTMTNLITGKKYSEIPGAVKLKKKTKTCPYCSKIINFTNYNRWHGDRCKKISVS